jgi:hypothetical protein
MIDLGKLFLMVVFELKMVVVEGISFGLIEHQGFNNVPEISFEFILHQGK